MNCTQCREQLALGRPGVEHACIDGSAVEAHLTECAACRQEAVRLESLLALLERQEQPSPGLSTRFEAAIGQYGQPRKPGMLAIFQRLWPTRPLHAMSYSFSLLVVGLLGGQMLPPGALGLHSPEMALPTGTSSSALICPVQYGPFEGPLFTTTQT